MRPILFALFVLAVILLACAGPRPTSRPSGSADAPSPTSTEPTAVPSPSASPAPSSDPSGSPAATPSEPHAFNAAERYLADGILRGAVDCAPVREALPPRSVGGIECASDDDRVARVGFYLFANDDDMLEAYYDRLRREGVRINSGDGCWATEGESEYIPSGEDAAGPDRHGCFINEAGFANHRLTLSGSHVYVGVLGRSTDLEALDRFIFHGSQDTPSLPTLWTPPY